MSNGFLDLKYIDIGEKKYQNNKKIEEIIINTIISYSRTLVDPYDQFFGVQTAKNASNPLKLWIWLIHTSILK